MTIATLCDQCDRRVDYEYQWRVKIEVRPSTNWLKRIFTADIPERKELHFCSKECVAAWAAQPDEEVSDVPVQG